MKKEHFYKLYIYIFINYLIKMSDYSIQFY